MSLKASFKVSKSFYLDTSVLKLIGDYAKSNEVSDSEAVRKLLKAGYEVVRSRGHRKDACPACRDAVA